MKDFLAIATLHTLHTYFARQAMLVTVLMLSLALSSAFSPPVTRRVLARGNDMSMMARKKKEMPANPVAVGVSTLQYYHIFVSM